MLNPMINHLNALRWLLLSEPLLNDTAVNQYTLHSHESKEKVSLFQFNQEESTAIQSWFETHERSDVRQLELTQFVAHRTVSNALSNPVAINQKSTQPTQRLGKYAERLLEYFLRFGPTHQLIASGVQLRDPLKNGGNGKRTIGEIDFLLKNAQGEYLHWELAIKFYLCHAQGQLAQPMEFVGPNRAYTLHRKLNTLFQSQLTHQPPDPWSEHTWKHQAFVKGWLFYRWGEVAPQCAVLNPLHCKGWWIDYHQLGNLPEGQYVILNRLDWLPPHQCKHQNTLDRITLLETLEQMKSVEPSQAILIACVDSNGHELNRGFIRL